MKRIALTDNNGSWFDLETAIEFADASDWNGNNDIHRSTGSQWSGQDLYYTRSGNWVLRQWSCYEGVLDTYESIDLDEAAQWLSQNDHYVHVPPLRKNWLNSTPKGKCER
tara:strand:- start:64 stop:393 length:330 start_codon:yes stop_codon:yes gene_type:complete